MKKLLLILLILGFAVPSYAEKRVFPESGVLSFGGLDNSSPPTTIKDGRASDLQNITLGKFGDIQKRYGYSRYGGTLDTNATTDTFESVTSIYELVLSSGTRYVLATCANKLFYYSSGVWTQMGYGLTITEGSNYQWSWVTALDYAIGTNGTDPPIKWSGSGNATTLLFTGLTSSVTDAKAIAWWKNYLVVGNTTEGATDYKTRIRWSNVGTIETWSDDDYVDIATQGGQDIVGFGVMYDELYVFLTNSIYKVSLVGGDELITVTKISEGVGCIARDSIQNIQIGNVENLVFLSGDGTVYTISGVKVQEISTLIEGTMDDLNYTRFPYAVSADDSQNSHYYLAITEALASVENDLLLDFNYAIGEWSKHTGVKANAMGIANDGNSVPQVFFGNYDSFIYQLNNTNYNSDVYAITGTFDDADIIDTTTASGLRVLYDNDIEDYVKLLLHFEGSTGSTQFIENTGKGVTPYGNAQMDTTELKFGISSGKFDGTGDYLLLADSDDYNFGNGNFTIDFWLYVDTFTTGYSTWIAGQSDNASQEGWTIRVDTDSIAFTYTTGGTSATRTTAQWDTTYPTDAWHHIAIVRNGEDLDCYFDGSTFDDTVDISTDTIHNSTYYMEMFGWGHEGSNYLTGYVDEFRISKGTARWTANFTVPTSAYTNSGFISGAVGGTLTITSGTGAMETSTIASTTSTGIVIVNSAMTATGTSVYQIGGIDAYYTTKWYDMGSPFMRKNFGTLFLWARTKTSPTLDLSYATDYVNTIETASASTYDYNILWGTGIDTSGAWTGEEIDVYQIPLNCSGRFLKMKFEEDDSDEDMYLKGYGVVYEALDIY